MAKRVTKKEMLFTIKNIVKAVNPDDAAMLVEFLENEMAAIDKKSEKAAAKAQEKREAEDTLYANVLSVLSKNPMTLDEVVDAVQVKDEEASRAKIVARLTAANKVGAIVKYDNKDDETGKEFKTYTLA